MSAKEEVSKETPERADVEALLAHWDFPFPLGEFKVLFGGYSGTSIKVVGGNGVRHVLKICHGYERADVEAQARVAVYARGCGCDEICTFYPVKGNPSAFAIERKKRPHPSVPPELGGWHGGGQGAVGGQGARIDCAARGGRGPRPAAQRPAARWRRRRLDPCRREQWRVRCAPPPLGRARQGFRDERGGARAPVPAVLHGAAGESQGGMDVARPAARRPPRRPFLDNIMLDPESGGLEGFVDMEDVCIGPLLFDIACCASACCFRADDNALDMRRMRHLLGGYASERPLGLSERKVFVAFMKLTMLCNCTWRFKNFNIDHRELESCRDAHVELQERIEALEDDMTAGFIEAILTELPKEKKPLAVAKPPPQGGAPKAPADATPAPAGKLSPFSVALGVAVVAAACVFFARRSR